MKAPRSLLDRKLGRDVENPQLREWLEYRYGIKSDSHPEMCAFLRSLHPPAFLTLISRVALSDLTNLTPNSRTILMESCKVLPEDFEREGPGVKFTHH